MSKRDASVQSEGTSDYHVVAAPRALLLRRDPSQEVPELEVVESGRGGRLAVEKRRSCVRSKITSTSLDACLQIVLLALLSFYGGLDL